MYKLINLKYVTLIYLHFSPFHETIVRQFFTSIVAESEKGQGIGVRVIKNSRSIQAGIFIFVCIIIIYYLRSAPSTATATATVAPTIGLLPIPMMPIISTCAGTDEEPAN